MNRYGNLDELVDTLGLNGNANHDASDPFSDWGRVALIVQQLVARRKKIIIGISGSQGSGKTTLARYIANAFGDSADSISLDDFYLPLSERKQLSTTLHPLLRTRGVPGTHDHQWLASTLDKVHEGRGCQVPVFDKATDDRSHERVLDAEVLVLEGWCLGARAQTSDKLSTAINRLEQEEDTDGQWRAWVNQQLQTHYEPIWSKIDFWIHLQVPSFNLVHEWRHQQEQEIPQTQRMNTEELRRFIDHYERITLEMWSQPPTESGLWISLDEQHRVDSVRLN